MTHRNVSKNKFKNVIKCLRHGINLLHFKNQFNNVQYIYLNHIIIYFYLST